MADSVQITAGAGTLVSTEEVTTLNGGAVSAQHLQRTATAIVTGDGVAVDLPGSSTDGLLVNLGTNNDVTVTGTVTANLAAGTNNVGDVDVLTVPAPLSTTGGGTEATAHRVTIASDSTGVLSVDDNGSSLTVDGTVGLTAGTGAPRPDNHGQTWVWKCVQSTTATTTNVWTPGSGKKIVLTYFQILATGTQDGDVQLWYAASGDTSYARGTDQVVFDGHFEPSATAAPGIALSGIWPCATADYLLKVTTSAAITVTIVAYGYEI